MISMQSQAVAVLQHRLAEALRERDEMRAEVRRLQEEVARLQEGKRKPSPKDAPGERIGIGAEGAGDLMAEEEWAVVYEEDGGRFAEWPYTKAEAESQAAAVRADGEIAFAMPLKDYLREKEEKGQAI